MASLKDTQQFTQKLDELVSELQSELGNGDVDFEKLVAVADELSEYADGLAETFSSVNDTLMERLQVAKSSRGSGSKSESKSDRSKATANAS
jgi:L-ribulose-5-phosphate 3-epimerase UlaE